MIEPRNRLFLIKKLNGNLVNIKCFNKARDAVMIRFYGRAVELKKLDRVLFKMPLRSIP